MTDPDQLSRVEHRMERTYEVAATPEQVWDAIATAEGMSAWMAPTRLDPQVGARCRSTRRLLSIGVVTDYTPNAAASRTRSPGRSPTTCRPPTTTCRRSPRSRPSSSSSRRPAAAA